MSTSDPRDRDKNTVSRWYWSNGAGQIHLDRHCKAAGRVEPATLYQVRTGEQCRQCARKADAIAARNLPGPDTGCSRLFSRDGKVLHADPRCASAPAAVAPASSEDVANLEFCEQCINELPGKLDAVMPGPAPVNVTKV